MAYYEKKEEHLDGALVLFQRNLDVAVPKTKRHRRPTWYMRLKIDGRSGYYTKSTKRTNQAEAYTFAKSELLRLQHAASLGHSLDEYTFEEHWQDWFDRQLRNDVWEKSRGEWHRRYAARYFKPYFQHADGTSMRLNEITQKVAAGYWDWRISYWSSPKGEQLKAYNPKRRGAKTASTNNAKKKPSAKTLEMEQTALNQIFSDAQEHGRSQQIFRMRAPKDKDGHNRRPHFESGNDYKTLARYLRSYRDCTGVFKGKGLNEWHRLHRKQMYYFVLFLANSGLRVGEAREMIWADVSLDIAIKGADVKIAEVRVCKDTKKRQMRAVQVQPNCNNYLKMWKQFSPHNDPNDPVWFGHQAAGDDAPRKFADLNKGFQAFLRRVPFEGREEGLLRNRDGERRTLYSLRHTYATLRLELGNVQYEDLSINMGCKVAQLEKHYSHVETKSRRREITQMAPKMREKATDIVPPAAVAVAHDPFALEAMRRYQNGELSQSAFLEIIAPRAMPSTSSSQI